MSPMSICEIEGCGKPILCRTYCNAHYIKWQRYKDPLHMKKRTPGLKTNCGKQQCPGNKKLLGQLDYLKNQEKYKARTAAWQKDNPERYAARCAEYFGRDDVKERARERTRKWSEDNKAIKLAFDRLYRKQNRAKCNALGAKYNASKQNATPAWLSEIHLANIQFIYEHASTMAFHTGERHDVDHIVPLNGKTVCGLHVPWNLRVLSRDANNKRKRIWCWSRQDC